MEMEKSVAAGGVMAILLLIFDVFDIERIAGEAYCAIRHPVEMLTAKFTDKINPNEKTCQQQHVIPKKVGGGDEKNIIWINIKEHDYTDRSSDQPWLRVKLWGDWGDHNLKQAYRMGVYANGYHFMLYDYNSEGRLTLFQWDGASHITYMVASIFNYITKEMSYIGYQWKSDRNKQYLDSFLGVFIDAAELGIGLGYGIIGVVIGTLFNPLDTICNLMGMVVYCIEAIVVGLWNTAADILSLLSLGYIQIQTAKW